MLLVKMYLIFCLNALMMVTLSTILTFSAFKLRNVRRDMGILVIAGFGVACQIVYFARLDKEYLTTPMNWDTRLQISMAGTEVTLTLLGALFCRNAFSLQAVFLPDAA
jgi:hypothetical protein